MAPLYGNDPDGTMRTGWSHVGPALRRAERAVAVFPWANGPDGPRSPGNVRGVPPGRHARRAPGPKPTSRTNSGAWRHAIESRSVIDAEQATCALLRSD